MPYFFKRCYNLTFLATLVNRSFRKVEKAADWLVGRAGPVFVAICILLVSIGAWTFFLCILPSVTPLVVPSFSLAFLSLATFTSYCIFVVYAVAWSYRYACLTPPGLVSSFTLASCRLAQGDLTKLEAIWQSYTQRAQDESPWIRNDVHAEEIDHRIKGLQQRGKTTEEIEEEDWWPRVKMCMKCKPIELWKALAYLPPELREVERLRRAAGATAVDQATPSDTTETLRSRSPAVGGTATASSNNSQGCSGHRIDEDEESRLLAPLRDSILKWLPPAQAYSLVPPPKPERTHHCSICKTCIVKFDHHCPWLNQAVGLHNERYFVMFLVWMVIACGTVAVTGWRQVYRAGQLWQPWTHPYVPRFFVLLTYVLCVVMGFALLLMTLNHLHLVSRNLTSVEVADSDYHKKLAAKRGKVWGHVYDLGTRKKNLAVFFNVGRARNEQQSRPGRSSARPAWQALMPIAYPPYSDGWHWAKRKGAGGRMLGVDQGEEIQFSDGESEASDDEGQQRGNGTNDDGKEEERKLLAGRTLPESSDLADSAEE